MNIALTGITILSLYETGFPRWGSVAVSHGMNY